MPLLLSFFASDYQSVACADHALCSPVFIEEVNLAGYTEAALVMLTVGCAYLAAAQSWI